MTEETSGQLVIRGPMDLRHFGITYLTGESCGYMLRGLYDVTEEGRQVLINALDVDDLRLHGAWNSGTGSIMLPYELWPLLAVFGLLQQGYSRVCEFGTCVIGAKLSHAEELMRLINLDRELVAAAHQHGKTIPDLARPHGGVRRYVNGTCESRNRHQMSGRTI